MPIPESQLETWSHRGAETTSKTTHETIRKALKSSSYLSTPVFVTYLQGSYRNTTNTYGNSDVDIVCELTSTYYSDISKLTEKEQEAYQRDFIRAPYSLHDFRQDVISALKERFPYDVDTNGRRSVKLGKASGRLAADVVVCATYRVYTAYISPTNCKYVSGIMFFDTATNVKIVNFPKDHYENGTRKNSCTSDRYKPTIRMLKNARSRMEQDGLIVLNTVPSYFVECLLYNVPDKHFVEGFQMSYLKTLSWLIENFNEKQTQTFWCQNGMTRLFGSDSTQWNPDKASTFIRGLLRLWDSY